MGLRRRGRRKYLRSAPASRPGASSSSGGGGGGGGGRSANCSIIASGPLAAAAAAASAGRAEGGGGGGGCCGAGPGGSGGSGIETGSDHLPTDANLDGDAAPAGGAGPPGGGVGLAPPGWGGRGPPGCCCCGGGVGGGRCAGLGAVRRRRSCQSTASDSQFAAAPAGGATASAGLRLRKTWLSTVTAALPVAGSSSRSVAALTGNHLGSSRSSARREPKCTWGRREGRGGRAQRCSHWPNPASYCSGFRWAESVAGNPICGSGGYKTKGRDVPGGGGGGGSCGRIAPRAGGGEGGGRGTWSATARHSPW